ncbi:AAA family ATPase [Corynebacterium fournieri]|uniref:AAA family ATPase n=1 Tax=Corynebacterium fournieri TaxID=1852390 RepID=UPI000A2EEBAA|nr:AAA family ATPase [Corynebacterium fournieri]WJY98540.1 vitamin B12-transporter ATPase [Corynebacterium fournieri]
MFLTKVRLSEQVQGYARDLPVVRRLADRPLELAQTTILTGDNGSGKSTLVEAIAVAAGANAAGGSRHARFEAADHSRLHASLTLTRRQNPSDVYFLRGETYLDLAEYHESLGPEDSLQDLTRRSHGQGIMRIARERFGPDSLIILDEPEDGLSVFSQLELLGLLAVLTRRGAQVLMATHSPVLLAVPDARIVSVPTLEPVLYDDCEPVTATQEFIDNPADTATYLVQP